MTNANTSTAEAVESPKPVNWQLLPPLTPDEYEALKADIAERGVLVPVEMDETGNLLDGHHRMRAVAELRSQGHPVCEPQRMIRKGWTDEQKRRHVYTLNLARRALSQEQKRDIACRLRGDGWTLEAVGRALAIGVGTAHRWTAELFQTEKLPERTVGADGKERPTTYAPREPEPATVEPLPLVPLDDDEPSYIPQEHPALDRIVIPAEPPPAAPAHAARRTDDRQDWATPQALFDVLDAEFNFTLDPCATPENAKCTRYFTEADDGLSRSWAGEVVFCNPPYGAKDAWVRKAFDEAAEDDATVVLLIPCTTDTALWWELCRKGEVRFLRGRLRFDDGGQAAPFPSALVIFWPGVQPIDCAALWWMDWQASGGDADV